MNIGITINSAWNIYNFRKGIILDLLKNNHKVIAIGPDDGYADKLKELGCDFWEVKMENKGSNPLHDLKLSYDLYKVYSKARLDVVLHYTIKPNIYGTIAAYLKGIPSINNVTGLGTVFLHNNLTSFVAKTLYKVAFMFPQKIFFQNHDDRDLFLGKKLVKKSVTDVIPGSGVNIDYFSSKNRGKNKEFTFLLIARILYDKGIVEYINAIKILRKKGINAKFQLLGAFDHNSSLGINKVMVDHWEGEGYIEYLGKTADVRPYIDKADCVVLPSYREGTPRSLLEAASHGKPMVATDVPGCREIVKDNYNGYLCEVKNAEDLADKMLKMINLEESERIKLGNNSRHLAVTKFDERFIINKYKSAISYCLGKEIATEYHKPDLSALLPQGSN
ncbi:glycosyltransferase family 4 protein [Flexithrix dorotheae]|uniref:glycosyltransferase family 4 protein n=1 Tax=Flexithrix dorotheae TaxID=70993 RepID=UPI00035FF630|nr:glycosyltransferase family 4 protein [Flexithrix dorotheae]